MQLHIQRIFMDFASLNSKGFGEPICYLNIQLELSFFLSFPVKNLLLEENGEGEGYSTKMLISEDMTVVL